MDITISITAMIGTAVLGYFSNMLIEYYKKQRKILTYRHGNLISLAKVEHELKDHIKVLFDGKEIQNLYYSVIVFKNEGNTIIENQNVIIQFEKNIEVIDFTVYQNIIDEKNAIGKIVKGKDGEFIFTINYLNIKENAEVKFLTSCEKYLMPEVIGRGKSLIIKSSTSLYKWSRVISGFIGSVIGGLILIPLNKYLFKFDWATLIMVIIVIVSGNLIYDYIFLKKRKKDETSH